MKGIVILGIKVHLIRTVTQLICNKNMNFQKKKKPKTKWKKMSTENNALTRLGESHT